MPAPKRELSPPESEPKIRKLDDDGDAMPSKVVQSSLQTGNSPERTAAPRTKIKRSCSPEGNNSRLSSPLSDCSGLISDPPLKKVKLLSTSASYTMSSEKTNTSLEWTASTDSDSEASTGGSNVNYFSVRNDSKTEELSFHPQGVNEQLQSSPSDSIQTDHSYGRITEISEASQDKYISQEFTSVVTESQRSIGTESVKTSTDNETETESQPNCVWIQALEVQELHNDNTPYPSTDNLDNKTTTVTSDFSEKGEGSSEPHSLFSGKVFCPVENVVSNEEEIPCIITILPTDHLIEVTTESVVEEFKQGVKGEHITLVEETCTDFASKIIANKNNSGPAQLAVSIPDSFNEYTTVAAESVDNLQQTDSNVQITFDESVKIGPLQDQMSNAFNYPFESVNETTEKLPDHKVERNTEIIQSTNEYVSQNFMSSENDLENHRDNLATEEIKGDSSMKKEEPSVEDATKLNGQHNAEFPNKPVDGISSPAGEIKRLKPPTDLGVQRECSFPSISVEAEATSPASAVALSLNKDPVPQNNEMTDDSPETQVIVCSVPAEDVQSKNLNTTDQYVAVETSEVIQLPKSDTHQCETVGYHETSENIQQEITAASNMDNPVVNQEDAHVSISVENEYINGGDKDDINPELVVVDVTAPACSSVIETIATTEVTSALSPKMCLQFQEFPEMAAVTDVDSIELSSVTENKNGKKADSVMDLKPTTLSDTLPAATEGQNGTMIPSANEEKNISSMNVNPNFVDASEATHEKHNNMVDNLKEDMVSQLNMASPVELPITSTIMSYENTNPITRQVEEVQESFICNAFTENTEDIISEYSTAADVHTTSAAEEISDSSSIVALDCNIGQQVATSDTEIRDVTVSKGNNMEVSAECQNAIEIDVELSVQHTVEENQTEVSEGVAENVSGKETQTNTVITEKVPLLNKVHNDQTHSDKTESDQTHSDKAESDQIQTQSVVVDTMQDITTVCKSQDTNSATDNIETNKSEISFVSETKEVLRTTEVQKSEGDEVTVIVEGQQDIPRLKVQNETTNQTEVNTHENQIVYEPISSPESTTDGDVPTLPNKSDTVMLIHANSTNPSQMIYSVSALSTNEEMGELHCEIKEQVVSDSFVVAEIPNVPIEGSSVISPVEEIKVKDQSYQKEIFFDNQTEMLSLQTAVLSSVSMDEDISTTDYQQAKNEKNSNEKIISESPAAPEILSVQESTVFEQLEQSNTAEDEKVAVLSSNEDAPDGQLENTDKKSDVPHVVSASVFTEQVQEASGLEVVVDSAVAAAVTDDMENPATDGTCEEYVILEPVPATVIHYDIVTEAVAESGLSGDVRAESEAKTEGILNEIQQTSEVKDTNNDESSHKAEIVVEAHLESFVQIVKIGSPPHPSDMMEVTSTDSSYPMQDEGTPAGAINMVPSECHILGDIEIGHEIIVAEEEQEEDSDISIIEKLQESTPEVVLQEKTEKNVNEIKTENKSLDNIYQDSTITQKSETEIKEPEKPKKQEMNTQARTKARQAALAEQRAAAAKRQAKRQQLNLLALCQEIAEDIATDSMLLKKIEEEKQAAAAAAKSETNKKEILPVHRQEEQPANVASPTPEGAELSLAPVTLPEDSPITQTSTDNAEESKSVAEPPKRRFFTSQVNVPLKVHEKKKLTRYQRLRQVELQIEKMSWARVKKLKTDQANQMFSDMDWQASMSFSSFSMNNEASPSQPLTSISKSPLASPTSTNITACNTEEPKAETPKPETSKNEPAKLEMPSSEAPKTATIEKTEDNKTKPPRKEESTAEASKPELRKSSRLSKIESSKAASAPTTKSKTAPKKVLPAVPPPMPNGLNTKSLKIEYKPYRPRPKYSPDDFELDDDPIPMPLPKSSPQIKPPHQIRPNVQVRPASQSTFTSKLTLSTQQVMHSKALTTPGQISGQPKLTSLAPAKAPAAQVQSKDTHASPLSSKLLPSAKVQQTTPDSSNPQTKVAVAPALSKPVATSLPQASSTITASLKETTSAENHSTGPLATPAAPQENVADDVKCKATQGILTAAVAPVEDSEVSDESQMSEKNKASNVQPENKSEIEEKVIDKATKLHVDQSKPQNAENPMSDASLQKEIKKIKEADKDGTQTILDAGQKHFGPVACSVCGMLYSAANPEDESQHLLFHNQFISAVKYVGWKKERILSEFHDGKIILVLPDDPKYALKKIEEIREMVDNDLGFQQVESKCLSKTKTFLFISNDKKVAGCLIAEHINEGYRVIEEPAPSGSEGEKMMFERQRAWCCSTTPEPAICGISRIWVVSTMRRQGIASRMLDCLRNNFIYGSNLSKDEIAFSDPTPDGKIFATHYFGTSQFLVYNFVNGTPTIQTKTEKVEKV